MPEQDDLFDNLEDDDQNDQSGTDTDETVDSSAPDQDDADTETESDSDKRINALMSRAQKAEAEAAKAKKELQKLQKKPDPKEGDQPENEFTQFMRENVRGTVFAQNPDLAVYGFKTEDIAGSTPAEMRSSLAKLTKTVNAMKAVALREAQEALGIDPAIGGGSVSDKLPDFGSMSDEEFAKYL